jgi:hypothetical protein
MNGPGPGQRRSRLLLAAVVGIIVAAVGIWAQNDALVGVNYDDGIYALLAKALADGDGYRLTFLPVDLPGVKYPPLYPLSLAPFWLLAGSQEAALFAMKLANGFYIGVAAGLFAFLLMDLGIIASSLAVVLALLGFVAGSIMLVTSGLLSEPLYLALLFLSLWLTDRTAVRPTPARLFAVGALAGLVFLTRSVGVAAMAAVLFAVWYRHGRRSSAIAASAAALVVAPWTVFSLIGSSRIPELLVPIYGSYTRSYLALVAESPLAVLEVGSANVGAILQTLGGKLVPEAGALLESLIGAALIVLAVLGSRRVFQTAPATATYAWFYLLPISLWIFPPFRFVFILFPLLLALAAVSFLTLAERAGKALQGKWELPLVRGRPLPRLAILAVGVLLLVHQAYLEIGAVRARVWDGAQYAKSAPGAEVVDWVVANTEPDAVVAFEFDPLVALHTGRPVIPNNYVPVHSWYGRGDPPDGSLARLFAELGARYVAVRRYIPAATGPIDRLMGDYPGGLELLHVTPGGVLIFETDLEVLRAPDVSDNDMGGVEE